MSDKQILAVIRDRYDHRLKKYYFWSCVYKNL